MVTERPNAGAVRHQDRCSIVRGPRGGGFVSLLLTASLRSTPLREVLEMPARSSPTSITLIAVTRVLFSWRRFSHEGARRSRVAVQVWPWFETLGQGRSVLVSPVLSFD